VDFSARQCTSSHSKDQQSFFGGQNGWEVGPGLAPQLSRPELD